MSNLISGKEALIALANGEDVEYQVVESRDVWNKVASMSVNLIIADNFKFRIKPKTITLNGIEIPAPFEPKKGDTVYFIDCDNSRGYSSDSYGETCEDKWIQFGAWRTEDEIKQVVEALRSIFKGV